MPKSPDKSVSVRIKSNTAEFISAESKLLSMTFLETLYHIVSVYREQKYEGRAPSPTPLKKVEPKPTPKIDLDKDEIDEDELDLTLFEV